MSVAFYLRPALDSFKPKCPPHPICLIPRNKKFMPGLKIPQTAAPVCREGFKYTGKDLQCAAVNTAAHLLQRRWGVGVTRVRIICLWGHVGTIFALRLPDLTCTPVLVQIGSKLSGLTICWLTTTPLPSRACSLTPTSRFFACRQRVLMTLRFRTLAAEITYLSFCFQVHSSKSVDTWGMWTPQ